MAWKHNGRTIQIGKTWISDDNTKYPRQWGNLTDAEKKSAGLVWEDDPVLESFDNKFYWAKGIERKLADENIVDDDGKAVIDPTTGKQMVNLGLKSIWIAKTKESTNNKLKQSDNRIAVDLPDGPYKTAWKNYRQALRDVPSQSDPFAITWPTEPS